LAEKSDTQRRGQLPHPAYARIKTMKISSKANTAFSQSFATEKISRYMVGHMATMYVM